MAYDIASYDPIKCEFILVVKSQKASQDLWLAITSKIVQLKQLIFRYSYVTINEHLMNMLAEL